MIYDWRTKKSNNYNFSIARYLSFSKLAFFCRVKKYVFEQIRKQYFFNNLCKSGPAYILDTPDTSEKLTTHLVKLSVSINDDLHHH